MADNVRAEAVITQGPTFASDDIGGVNYPRTKIVIGADGVNDGDISAANPFPIGDAGGSITVDNGGTFAVQAAQTGTWTVTGAGGSFPVTDSGGSLTVDNGGTFAVQAAQSGTWTVTGAGGSFPVTDSGGSLTVDAPVGTPVFVRLSDGTDPIPTLPVSLASVPSHEVTNAGTFAVQAASAGDVAHDTADSGNPVKCGAKATTALSGATLVASGDRTDLFAGVDGAQIVRPHCNLEDIVTGNASNTDGTSAQCIAAQASGIKTYLSSVVITNTSSSNIYVEVKDGTTVKVTIPVPANSGAIFNPPVPIPGSAATAWNFDPSTGATTVYCSMVGFRSKV